MGLYLNPMNGTKEEWLNKHGVPCTEPMKSLPKEFPQIVPVCWIDNGPFTAAGVVFSARELEAFNHPDKRFRIWYLVPIEKVKEATDPEQFKSYFKGVFG